MFDPKTAEQLQDVIEEALHQVRPAGLKPKKVDQHIYEAADGRFVLVGMNNTEAYYVERNVFGREVAEENALSRAV